MRIKWLGHACFLVVSDKGLRLVTDPFTPGSNLSLGPPRETADVVFVSHSHADHNNVGVLIGKPEVVKDGGSRIVHGVPVKGIVVHHDEAGGKQRGSNIIYCLTVDGVRLCHLGDLGHMLTQEQASQIGAVDVLMVPVGGVYTIDAAGATRICELLKPGIILPMHYRTPKVHYPINGVDDFLSGKPNIRRLDSSEIEVKAGQLPANVEIVVLKAAL